MADTAGRQLRLCTHIYGTIRGKQHAVLPYQVIFTAGDITAGQLGQGNTGASINEPKLISNGRNVITIADLHVCAIDIAGDGFCWGWQDNGQLGDNTGTTDRHAPVAIKSPYKWRNLSAGVRSSCGITTENELYCWGAGSYYRLGTGSTANSNTPLKVSTSEKFKYVEGGRDYFCALSINNDLYCWGRNEHGQIGDNKVGVDRQTPYLVMSDVHSFGAGLAQMCALKNSGKAYCTGNAEHGRLGNATSASVTFDAPTAVMTNFRWLKNMPYDLFMKPSSNQLDLSWTAPEGMSEFVIIRKENEEITDELTDGVNYTVNTVVGDSKVVYVGTAANFTDSSLTNGKQYHYKIFAHDGTRIYQTPAPMLGIATPQHNQRISTSYSNSCAVDANNKAYCWGTDNHGALGSNNQPSSDRSTPLAVHGLLAHYKLNNDVTDSSGYEITQQFRVVLHMCQPRTVMVSSLMV